MNERKVLDCLKETIARNMTIKGDSYEGSGIEQESSEKTSVFSENI